MKNLLWYININKHVIAQNNKRAPEDAEPPVRFCRGRSGKQTYCHELELPAGSRIVYQPDKPLVKCGARLVIVSPEEPKVIR